jgi:hypothetical protein
VTWGERLFDVLDDLEGRAEALYAVERDAEVSDRSRSEYAAVPLAARTMASVGRDVVLEVTGVGRVSGVLSRAAGDWCLVAGSGRDWLVASGSIEAIEGLSDRAVPELAWPATARLGLGSALRRLADDGTACVLHTRSGARTEAVVLRVGRDFVEVQSGEPVRRLVVALAGLAAVSNRA